MNLEACRSGPSSASQLIQLLIQLLLTPSPHSSKKSQCRTSREGGTADFPSGAETGASSNPFTMGICLSVPLNPLILKLHFSCGTPLCKYQSESRSNSSLKSLFCSIYSLLSVARIIYSCLVGVYLIKLHYLPGLWGQNERYRAVNC